MWDEVCSPKMQWWSLLALADQYVINSPYTLLRHHSFSLGNAEEDFWHELGQQFNVPHSQRHQLALYRLCDSEPKQLACATRQHMVKESLGPAPVRVACADASDYLRAWRWADALAFERFEFLDDDGPGAGCGDPPQEQEQGICRSSSTLTKTTALTISAEPL